MNEQIEQTLEGVETYTTPKSFLCSLCCNLVIRDKPAVLIIYSHIDDNPLYILDDEEDDGDLREFTFVRLCPACGGDHV